MASKNEKRPVRLTNKFVAALAGVGTRAEVLLVDCGDPLDSAPLAVGAGDPGRLAVWDGGAVADLDGVVGAALCTCGIIRTGDCRRER